MLISIMTPLSCFSERKQMIEASSRTTFGTGGRFIFIVPFPETEIATPRGPVAPFLSSLQIARYVNEQVQNELLMESVS